MGGGLVRTALVAGLGAAALGSVSCRSYDAQVFDARLRQATFDAYVETIETQFEGLGPAQVTIAELRARYEELARRSATPAAFYGVLRALLADLDDPHAALTVSPRFWSGPVAEPEWIQFVEAEGRVHAGLPAQSIRSIDAAERALSSWLVELGVRSLADLDPAGAASFLRTSAAFGPRFPGTESERIRALTEPLTWWPLESIDGHPVESPHDAELLIRGALGSIARLQVLDDRGAPLELGAVRNAGVFEDEEPLGGLRRRLHPLELAEQLDPSGRVLRGNRPTARAPRQALRAKRRWIREAMVSKGDSLGVGLFDEEEHQTFGASARVLTTPEGRRVAYLRIGSFRARGEDGQAPPEDASLQPLMAFVAQAFAAEDHWIIDVTGNPGGSWAEAGLFMSYFLEPDAELVPHEVRSTTESGGFLLKVRTLETHRLRRADVEPLRPRTIHVLVDQDTASAGEIVASFLRGACDAVLVGERTAGAEYSTGEFRAPDGSVLRIGLGGGMMEPFQSFQGQGLDVDLAIEGATEDLETWRALFPLLCRSAALADIDAKAPGAPAE